MSKEVGNSQRQCLTPPENAAIITIAFYIEAKEKKIARQVVLLQVVTTLVSACIVYYIKGAPEFAALLSGGGTSVVNGAMLAWRMNRAASHHAYDAHHQLRLMYFYASERFLVVGVLLCICIAVLKLSPLELLGGFVMGQVVLPLGRLFLSGFETEDSGK